MNLSIRKYFINFFSFVTCLLPAALISGPFISDLFLSSIALFFLIISIKEKLFIYYKNIFVYFFLAFYLFIIFGSLNSETPLNSLESSLFYFRFLFFSIGVVFLIDNQPKLPYYFGYILFFTIFTLVIDAYLQFFTGKNSLGFMKWDSGMRISGFLKDESLGRYLAYLMPLMFAMLSMKKNIKKYEIIAAMVILILVDVIIYLSGERTSFLLLSLGTMIIVISIKRYKYTRAICFILSIIIAFSLTIYYPQVKKRVIDTTIEGFDIDSGDIKIINYGYQSLYATSLNMFMENPIIGVGVKNFRVECSNEKYYINRFSCSTHPHNSMLQFLSETGLIGSIFYFLGFLFCSIMLLKNLIGLIFKKQKYILEDYQVCLYAGFFVVLWPLAPSLNFFNNWISIIYFLPLPFLLQDKKKLISQ